MLHQARAENKELRRLLRDEGKDLTAPAAADDQWRGVFQEQQRAVSRLEMELARSAVELEHCQAELAAESNRHLATLAELQVLKPKLMRLLCNP